MPQRYVPSFVLLPLLGVLALCVPQRAWGADLIGLKPGLRISYAAPDKEFDAQGKSQDITDTEMSSLLLNLNLEYSPPLLGLVVGADMPYVSNKVSRGGQDLTGSGVGDLSLYGGYRFSLMDTLSLLPALRVKFPTGQHEFNPLKKDSLPTGSGHTNLQPSVKGMLNLAGVAVDLELGYLVSLEAEESSFGVTITSTGPSTIEVKKKVNPGDVLYLNLGVGYWIADTAKPRVNLIYGTSGENRVEGNTIPDSQRNWLALALGVDLKLLSTLYATAELGTTLEAQGENLPYGYVLSGKNTLGGIKGFTLAASLQF